MNIGVKCEEKTWKQNNSVSNVRLGLCAEISRVSISHLKGLL